MNDAPQLDKKILEEYAALKIDEKRVAERIKELQPEIKEAMMAQGADKINMEVGSFTLGSMTRWQYSKAVKDLQEKEKASGTAKQVVSTILYFKQPKQPKK